MRHAQRLMQRGWIGWLANPPPPPFLKSLFMNTKILIENYQQFLFKGSVQQLPFRGEKKMMTLCFFLCDQMFILICA